MARVFINSVGTQIEVGKLYHVEGYYSYFKCIDITNKGCAFAIKDKSNGDCRVNFVYLPTSKMKEYEPMFAIS